MLYGMSNKPHTLYHRISLFFQKNYGYKREAFLSLSGMEETLLVSQDKLKPLIRLLVF